MTSRGWPLEREIWEAGLEGLVARLRAEGGWSGAGIELRRLPPWRPSRPGWARRLCGDLAPAIAERLALVVALLDGTRGLVDGEAMAAGLALLGRLDGGAALALLAEVERRGAGVVTAHGWLVVPTVWRGGEVEAGLPLAAAITRLGELVEPLAALLLDGEGAPGSDDLEARLGGWLAEESIAAPLLGLLAGATASGARRRRLRAALGGGPLRGALGVAIAEAVREARRVAATGPLGAAAVVDQLAVGAALLDDVAQLGALLSPPPPVPSPATVIAAAKGLLGDDPRFAEAWEVRRRGSPQLPAGVVGQLFPRALILATVGELGAASPAAQALFAEALPPGELRYYDGGAGFPPDSDLLGIVLLAGASGVTLPAAPLRGWLDLLQACRRDDGRFPTWLARPAAGPPPEPLLGDDSPTVRLHLALGLGAHDAGRFAEALAALARGALGDLRRDGFAGDPYYDAPYSLGTWLRFAAAAPGWPLDAALQQEVASAARGLAARLAAAQRPDGGWGSPLATALILGGLLQSRGIAAAAVARAVQHLGALQDVDGGWRAEGLYTIPGADDRLARHGSRLLTTAFCLRALLLAERAS